MHASKPLRKECIKSLLESKLAIQNFHVYVYVNEEVKQFQILPQKKGHQIGKTLEEKLTLYLCFPKFIDLSDKNLRTPLRKCLLKQNSLFKAFIKLL